MWLRECISKNRSESFRDARTAAAALRVPVAGTNTCVLSRIATQLLL